ncbi:uncharacterized, partial [Tachysurus ichikawai]
MERVEICHLEDAEEDEQSDEEWEKNEK